MTIKEMATLWGVDVGTVRGWAEDATIVCSSSRGPMYRPSDVKEAGRGTGRVHAKVFPEDGPEPATAA